MVVILHDYIALVCPMSFIHDDFLLQSQSARDLYHDHAEASLLLTTTAIFARRCCYGS